jgi:hypothetical protein
MALLELNQEQCQALRETLKLVLPDLSVEIANTDLKSFRDNLKERRDHLNEVMAVLGSME